MNAPNNHEIRYTITPEGRAALEAAKWRLKVRRVQRRLTRRINRER